MVEFRDLAEKWDSKSGEESKKAVKSLKKMRGGLRVKVALLISQLEDRINRVDYMVKRLQERDKQLYSKLLEAQERGDTYRATAYAGEISEIRKMAKRLIRAQAVLEQVKLRVETVRDLGELASIMYHVRPLIGELESQLKGVLPELALDLHNINETLIDAFMSLESIGFPITTQTSTPIHLDDEAKRVLEEAAVIAESRVDKEFPGVKKKVE